MGRGYSQIVLLPGSPDNGNNVAYNRIFEELLSDVVFAVAGFLKSQIKLVALEKISQSGFGEVLGVVETFPVSLQLRNGFHHFVDVVHS